MRVTKTVREYIQKEVTTRMEQKYSAEAAEAERQHRLYDTIEQGAREAAAAAYVQYVHEAIKANNAENFLRMYDAFHKVTMRPDYHSDSLELITSDVLTWRNRAREEANEKVNEIVVTLELGGTKAELMQMLAEI